MTISYAPSKTATRMWALTGASFTVPRNILVASLDSTPVTIPVPTYLIEHERGLVLFDTGCNPRAATDPEAVYGPLAGAVGFSMTPEQTVDAQIRGLGYRLDDVKYVVPSHLHFDHAGGLYLFPDARFYTMHGELQEAYWPPPNARGFFLVEDYLPTRGFDWFELPDDHDLFGDGSVVLLKTPGHTAGGCSLLIRLRNQVIILAGDAAHLREGIESVNPMPFNVDTRKAAESIYRLRALRESLGARIWVSHDPEDWVEMPHSPQAID
jgi:N-acyl homoserine lactone hydrolase